MWGGCIGFVWVWGAGVGFGFWVWVLGEYESLFVLGSWLFSVVWMVWVLVGYFVCLGLGVFFVIRFLVVGWILWWVVALGCFV